MKNIGILLFCKEAKALSLSVTRERAADNQLKYSSGTDQTGFILALQARA